MDWFASAPAKLLGSVVHRPYVFLFLAAYLVLATAHLGAWRVLRMTAVGYVVAWASEFTSIHVGFPYGLYRYLEPALENDLMVFGVPFFDSLSYTFLAYFAWAGALYLRGPLHVRRPADVQIAERLAVRRSPATLLLAAFLMTWMDVAVDPVSNLGDRWFLGKIYAYESQGAHFGVPLSNYFGWLLTGALIVAAYQRIDRAGDEFDARGERRLYAQGLFGPATYCAVVTFALSVTFAIGEERLGWTGLLLQAPVVLAFAGRLLARRADEAQLEATRAELPQRPL